MAVEDDQLLASALAGDLLALQHLLLKQFAALENHIAARIPAEHRSLISAEDVLQETFSQAFRDIGGLKCEQESELAAWLRAIADNRLTDAVRGLNCVKRGGKFHRRQNQAGSSSSLVQLVERLCTESGTPSRSVARREAAQAIQMHVAALPEAEREAIRAKYFDGCEVAEIAEQLGRSPGAIRGLLNRAHKRLADLLGRSSQWLDR